MKLSKHKLGELIEVTRGASLSGQFYAEKGELIRLTLGNFIGCPVCRTKNALD